MKLLKCILTENDCYQTKRTIQPRGVMVHSTGANNPTLRRYVQPAVGDPERDTLLNTLGINKNGNHWNRAGIDVCVHGFIGKLADGSVAAAQTLPWTHRGWHAGDGTSGRSANDTHISFEICEDGLTDPAYFKLIYHAVRVGPAGRRGCDLPQRGLPPGGRLRPRRRRALVPQVRQKHGRFPRRRGSGAGPKARAGA